MLVANYPWYFLRLRSRLRTGGVLLNHCIFPDGELTGSGRINTEVQKAWLEVLQARLRVQGSQLHQVLAVNTGGTGRDGGVPLRPWWAP